MIFASMLANHRMTFLPNPVIRHVLALAMLLWACNDPEDAFPVNVNPTGATPETGGGILVGHEGNFGWGYASLSWVDVESDSVYQEVFRQANRRILGNVLQSMMLRDSLIYLVVNNSQKIEIIRQRDFASMGSISGLTSPRYLLEYAPGQALCTDLYANAIHLIDLEANAKVGEIPAEGQTGQMVLHEGWVFVSNRGANQLLRLSVGDWPAETIPLGGAPYGLAKADGRIWTVVSRESGRELVSVDLETLAQTAYPLPESESFSMGLTKVSEDTLAVMSGGLYCFQIGSGRLSDMLNEPDAEAEYYGLTYLAEPGLVLMADARNFDQPGWVMAYSRDFEQVGRWRVGIIPSSFLYLSR